LRKRKVGLRGLLSPGEGLSGLGETFISVDIETSGQIPSQYSILSIGACTVDAPESETLYVELQPLDDLFEPEAMAINGLSLKELRETGLEPGEAMKRFEEWVGSVVPPGNRAVFAAFNAPFDWSFVNDYFQRFLRRNPFGHSALDMKAFYMGLTGLSWSETSLRYIVKRYGVEFTLSHNALRDAQDQAHLFSRMLEEQRERLAAG
jgi:ribonuclease T